MTTALRPRAVALGVLALAIFVFLAIQVAMHGAVTADVDPAVTAWFAAHRTPFITQAMRAVSDVHSTIGIDSMLVIAAAFLVFAQRRWRDAIWMIVAVESSMLLNVLVKYTFARPRPVLADPLVHLSTFSFPSGHALASTAFWGCVVCLVPAARRGTVACIAVLLVLLVALSRVYLGAHFLSDVIAGACEGIVCVTLWRPWRRASPSASR